MKAILPYGMLAGLVLVFFSPLVAQPTHVLYADRSDLIAMHLPNKVFLVRSWQETGEVPLWNPYVFGGMPFAQDMQVAAFYPLYLPLYVLPESWLGPAMSWLVVLHVMIAAWCAYAYAREYLSRPSCDSDSPRRASLCPSRELEGAVISEHACPRPHGRGSAESTGRGADHLKTCGIHPGAFVAAIGYAFAGKWMLHLLAGGHFPMLGLAWVPLVLLFLDRVVRFGRWRQIPWAGGAFALIILGSHPQVMFYSGLFVALWTLGAALERAGWFGMGKDGMPSTLRALGAWLGCGMATVIVASFLAAIQLLPNLAVVPESSRGQGMENQEGIFVAIWKATELIGPPLAEPTWEERGGFTLLWLILGGMGLVVGPRRLRFAALVWLIVVLFGLGGAALFHAIPGFSYFRLPGRALWFAALPMALLAGYFVQCLLDDPDAILANAAACRVVLLAVVVAAALLVGLWALAVRQLGKPIQPHAIAYWAFAGLMASVLYVLLLRRHRWSRGVVVGMVGVLILDLWSLSWPFVEVRDLESVYEPSACVRYIQKHLRDHGRVLDRDVTEQPPGVTPLGFALPMLLQIEPVRGWHSLDVRRYKEYLQFIADRDEPIHPSDVMPNFPIRNKQLLDFLGVQHLLRPKEDAMAENGGWHAEFTDEDPYAFGVVNSSGMRSFPPYEVDANQTAMPRAFLVHQAKALAERPGVLAQLRDSDLRKTVLLEHAQQDGMGDDNPELEGAMFIKYHPNEVSILVHATQPGWLVLSDVWYPGWEATVDGMPTVVERANYAFRAVAVPPGKHAVELRMRPTAYVLGKVLSGVAILGLALYCVGMALMRFRTRHHSP